VLDDDGGGFLGFDETGRDLGSSEDLVPLFELGVSDPVGETLSYDTDSFEDTVTPEDLGSLVGDIKTRLISGKTRI